MQLSTLIRLVRKELPSVFTPNWRWPQRCIETHTSWHKGIPLLCNV